jgi:ABC-type dipeptide/oligopeptide/nickel transport system permease component
MLAFIVKRLLLAIPALLVISFLVFFVARLAPSGPVEIIAGDKAPPQVVAQLKHEYGLDKPVLVQYKDYILGIVTRGDLGKSFQRGGQPITQMIKDDFPTTFQLAYQALLFAILIGIPIGIFAALYHNSWFDRVAMLFVVALVSVPSIVLGPLLVLLLAVQLRWLPTDGWASPLHTLLPTVTLGARSAALLARFMRSSLLDVLRQDYLRTAIAKGLSRGKAVWRHGIKNALIPVLTVMGTVFGALLSGSFVVETIFRVPGIGFESINSITKRDYPVIQGMALLVATLYILVNLAVDVCYGWIDPRIRSQEAKS